MRGLKVGRWTVAALWVLLLLGLPGMVACAQEAAAAGGGGGFSMQEAWGEIKRQYIDTWCWQFRKSAEVCVIPHKPRDWAIWYAYTEIYSDRDQERWCIFGSDDYGKAWLNGEPVYGSGKTPHPWIPDRAYRKCRFKKGFNPLLFKVENAWGRTGFSMCVYLGEM